MTGKTKRRKAALPSRDALLAFLRDSTGPVGKREIARAFRLDSADKIELKRMLRALAEEGAIERGRKRRVAHPGGLADTAVVEITGTDADGELIGRPLAWEGAGQAPRILIAPWRGRGPALGAGDRVLAKLRRLSDRDYEARPIRRIEPAPARVLGLFEPAPEGGRLVPTDKRDRSEYRLAREDCTDLRKGELILAEILPGRPFGLKLARPIERLGSTASPKAASLIALAAHDIPQVFPEEALAQAAKAGPAPLGRREDLRKLPLVTIDGEDARDFDDAVFAEPDGAGGWRLAVAIADVAWYVRPDDALDREALKRGNSVYFPDRVVPMLPEALSNGWCSLKPGEDRPCLVAHLAIDGAGNLVKHRFTRALMRSVARLTYSQIQAAKDGKPDAIVAPLMDKVVTPLYGAYGAMLEARKRRGALELEMPERKVELDAEGRVLRIAPRPVLDSHKLIEEFMIAANVAAAQTLEGKGRPCLFRIHAEPAMDKLESLRAFLETLKLRLAKGQVITASLFNTILAKVAGTPQARLVNEVVLRSQAQAVYSPDNIGHFGLALARYAHFTSPIRRYADLVVHRSLIATLGLGEGGLAPEDGLNLAATAKHVSETERRAAGAERDAVDRYLAAFLAERVGAAFTGRVNGVTRFGLFVTLDETGADGLVPIRSLPDDYYIHDEKRHSLAGRRNRLTFRLGDAIRVRLVEANPITGGMIFQRLP
ncbi:MAG: ribonuclease R [Rhodospirillales bacterium]|nr:ribonuclease R [Rhodospirillales bacterium]